VKTLIVSTRQPGDDARLTTALGCPAAEVVNPGLWRIVGETPPAGGQGLMPRPGDWWIIPSRHAVPYIAALPVALRRKVRAICLGHGTERQLQAAGVGTIRLPAAGHDSEALLAMAEMQQVAGRTITLLTAPGGRDLIPSTLRQRGAEVRILYVYRREPSAPDPAVLARIAGHQGGFVTLATSAGGLKALLDTLPPRVWQHLLTQPVIVISKRLAASAAELGFTRIVSSPDPGTESLATCCRTLLSQYK